MTWEEITAGRDVTVLHVVNADFYEDAVFIAELLRNAGYKDVIVRSPRWGVYEVAYTPHGDYRK